MQHALHLHALEIETPPTPIPHTGTWRPRRRMWPILRDGMRAHGERGVNLGERSSVERGDSNAQFCAGFRVICINVVRVQPFSLRHARAMCYDGHRTPPIKREVSQALWQRLGAKGYVVRIRGGVMSRSSSLVVVVLLWSSGHAALANSGTDGGSEGMSRDAKRPLRQLAVCVTSRTDS